LGGNDKRKKEIGRGIGAHLDSGTEDGKSDSKEYNNEEIETRELEIAPIAPIGLVTRPAGRGASVDTSSAKRK
jgi:hypothetical protein